MAKQPAFPYLGLFLTLSLCSCTPRAAFDSSVYESFLQCLKENTSPQDQISDLVYSQSNLSYTSVLEAYIRNARFNVSTTSKPLVIVTPKQVAHVHASVVCTKKVGYQLKIRSGGHDFEGISYVSDTPFFILDMSNLRSVEIDIKDESGWVQAGATLGELYHKIWQNSKVHSFPAGVCPTVGVGGHLSGGGYGNMLRKYGLSVDHVVDAQIVDVNGKLLDRKAMGEDLFWAVRGGGGASFGVIISYRIKLVPIPETVTVFRVERYVDQDNATDVAYKWQLVAPKTDENLFMRMLIQPVTSKAKKGEKTIRVTVIAQYLGYANSLLALLGKEFPELGLTKEDCLETDWIHSVVWWANYDIGTSPDVLLDRNPNSANFLKRKSDYVQNPISKDGLEWLWSRMLELGKTGLVFNSYGGKMDQIPASDTPFPHRAGNLFKIQYSVNWEEPGSEADKKYINQIRRLYSYTTPFVSKNPRSAYLNYRDLDIGVMGPGKNNYDEGKVYGYKYFKGNFDRLVKVKTAVDPENFFRNEQSIPTQSRHSSDVRSHSRCTIPVLVKLFVLLHACLG
ncbi:hypothetical protein K2173_000449 [Erythroxylum novogranatense]|uniref:FAD-binding PCMH-type domain-containing protein n=1 Tax=Erythroxylum novogranatense TaxID=1862640 RepID=A0AAV8SWN3_9ROSI|nr:hypothetical protein K2173_000449 [Erythroxylum novogranatense]